MYAFSPENRLVLAACSPNPDSAQLRQAISEIDNWDKASGKLIKKGVAPLFWELLNQHPELVNAGSEVHELKNKSTTVEQFDRNVNFQSEEKPEDKGIISSNSLMPENKGFINSDRKVPEEVAAKLRQTYLKTMSRSMLLYDAFREIAEALSSKGIKAVALKGVYLAENLYPKIGMRQFSDIDLLVNHNDAKAVVKTMELLGFRMTEPAFGEAVAGVFESAHLRPMVRKGVSVEVHTRLHGPTQSYRLPESEMIQRSVPTTINGQAFRVFELHDLLIHLCLHLDKHFNSSHMQMYSWADIALLLTKRGHELNENLLWSRCAEYNAEKEVRKVLVITNALFGASLPANAKFQQEPLSNKAVKTEGELLTDAEVRLNITPLQEDVKSDVLLFPGKAGDSQKGSLPEDTLKSEQSENRLSSALIEQLTRHLDDRVSHESGTQTHLFFIRRIKSPLGKLNYLREVLLPGKKLMLRSYKIKNERLFWLWYPYRMWVGLKGFFWKNK